MYPSYSALFTLGLLANPSTVPSPSSPAFEDGPSEPIYFTFAGTRDSIELRSFLYLDLADNRRHPPSHRRKYSTLSKSTSWTCTADLISVHDIARSEKPVILSPVPPLSARRRTSKESLRNIPSPKPAPSATLPDLPIPVSPSSSKKRPASTVVGSLLSPTRLRRTSLRTESISSHDRRESRMDALACLEGRSRAPNRIARTIPVRKNFMSFSDDEDDKWTLHKPSASAPSRSHVEDPTFADVEDETDGILPVVRRRETDQVKLTRPKLARKRRGTIESWFPLKSFIDLKDDDLSSWNWRSFIEIGGVA